MALSSAVMRFGPVNFTHPAPDGAFAIIKNRNLCDVVLALAYSQVKKLEKYRNQLFYAML